MKRSAFVGGVRIASDEFLTRVKSPGLIASVVLFGLIIIGASYGWAQPMQGAFSQILVFAHPTSFDEGGVVHYFAAAFVTDTYGHPLIGQKVLLFEGFSNFLGEFETNASGGVSVDVGTDFPGLNVYTFSLEGRAGSAGTSFGELAISNNTFTIRFEAITLSTPFGPAATAHFHVSATDGTSASTAEFYLDGAPLGHPDLNGYFRVPVPRETHLLRAVFRGSEAGFSLYGYETRPVFENPSDSVLSALSFEPISWLLPAVAIVGSFDAFVGDWTRATAEEDSRLRRAGAIFCKGIGILAATGLPTGLILLAAIGAVTLFSGRPPTLMFATGFVISGLFLIAAYVFLMVVLSTQVRESQRSGERARVRRTRISAVYALAVWIVVNIIFGFVVFVLLFRTDPDPGRGVFFDPLALLWLLDPTATYYWLVASMAPVNGQASFGLVPVQTVSPISIFLWAGAWLTAVCLSLVVCAEGQRRR